MKKMLCVNKDEKTEAYRSSIRFCIKDINNPDILKVLSCITQNIWQNEKRQERDQDDPGG